MWVASALLPIALSASCLAALAAEQAWLSRVSAGLPSGPVVRMCVSVRLTGGMRLAAWWGSAFNGRTGLMRRPFMMSNMACGLAPWGHWLPPSGALETSD